MTKSIFHFKNNLNKFFYIFSFLIFIIFVISYLLKATISFDKDELGLTWQAGTVIIPLIDHIRGNLPYDFMSSSSINSPYIHSARILSSILPKNKELFIPTFTLLSNIFGGIIYSLAAINIALFSKIITNKNEKNFYFNYGIIFIFITLIYLIPHTSKFLLTGAIVGYWFFPISESLQPTGIALFLSLITLLIPLIIESRILIVKYKTKKILLRISKLIHALSVYIHPVISLFQIIISLVVSLIYFKKKEKEISWTKSSITLIIIWLIGCIYQVSAFNQDPINASEFFRIYVLERHPHHYLPSYYLGIKTISIVCFNLLVIFLINRYELTKKDTNYIIIFTSISACFILFATHFIQYIAVELLNIDFFIKLGISRMSSCFNFLYLSIIISNLFNLINIFKNNKLIIFLNNILKKKKIIKNFTYSLIILFIFSSINLYRITSNSIENNVTIQLSNYFKKSNIKKNSEFIFDDSIRSRYSRAREIGNLNIYSDNYFPFNIVY